MLYLRAIRQVSVFVLLLATAVPSVQAGGVDITDTVKKSFKVEPGGTLHLDLDYGNIEVSTTQQSRVLIEVERRIETDDPDEARRVLDRHDRGLSIRASEHDVHLQSHYDKSESFWKGWWNRSRLKVHVHVRVPEHYHVDFSNGAGNVRITSVAGRVSGSTGAGNVEISDVRGPVEVSSGSGNIDVSGVEDRVQVSTGAGNLKLFGITGALTASTGAGNIEAEITRQPQQGSSLESGAGNVTVYLAGEVGVDVDAQASVGSASSDFPVTIEGNWMKRSFAGAVNGGGPSLHLRAGVGNVSLKKQ